MTIRIQKGEIDYKEAQSWGVSYLARFLRGKCPSWSDAIDQEGLVDRAALARLSMAELDHAGRQYWNLLHLIHKSGHRTPQELWHENEDELVAWANSAWEPEYPVNYIVVAPIVDPRSTPAGGRSRPRLIIGVAGATCSGKTMVTRAIAKRVGQSQVTRLEHDAYYKDLSDLPPADRAQVNFDHPDALDTELLTAHIRQLRDGVSVKVPIYDFTTHTRRKGTHFVQPKPIILVEGILILTVKCLRDLFDIKVFLDIDMDICFIRRFKRDIDERGRTMESVVEQFSQTVWPMYKEFVEPSKRHADLIIPQQGIHNIVAQILNILQENRREIDGRQLAIRDCELT